MCVLLLIVIRNEFYDVLECLYSPNLLFSTKQFNWTKTTTTITTNIKGVIESEEYVSSISEELTSGSVEDTINMRANL